MSEKLFFVSHLCLSVSSYVEEHFNKCCILSEPTPLWLKIEIIMLLSSLHFAVIIIQLSHTASALPFDS